VLTPLSDPVTSGPVNHDLIWTEILT